MSWKCKFGIHDFSPKKYQEFINPIFGESTRCFLVCKRCGKVTIRIFSGVPAGLAEDLKMK